MRICICKRAVYKIRICESLGFAVRKTMFRCVKGDVWGDETWSLAQSKLTFRGARAELSQNEEWRVKNEESTFTFFNFSFITFPRQVFVNIFPDLSILNGS